MLVRNDVISEKFSMLHLGEEELRNRAIEAIQESETPIELHLFVIELAMDVADTLRKYETNDEDLKVIQLLGMRTFNAFAASLKLAFSGYYQNSALILRDILETVFLLDLFDGDRNEIGIWRNADEKQLKASFSAIKIRIKLDERDGYTGKKRAKLYKLFSELAAHPTMKSSWMMRPEKDGDAVIGPFMELSSLQAVLSEMGRLAVQVGQTLENFMPTEYSEGTKPVLSFSYAANEWMRTFYPKETRK